MMEKPRVGGAFAVSRYRTGSVGLGHKALRLVGVRDDDADQPPVLIVEDVAPRKALT